MSAVHASQSLFSPCDAALFVPGLHTGTAAITSSTTLPECDSLSAKIIVGLGFSSTYRTETTRDLSTHRVAAAARFRRFRWHRRRRPRQRRRTVSPSNMNDDCERQCRRQSVAAKLYLGLFHATTCSRHQSRYAGKTNGRGEGLCCAYGVYQSYADLLDQIRLSLNRNAPGANAGKYFSGRRRGGGKGFEIFFKFPQILY